MRSIFKSILAATALTALASGSAMAQTIDVPLTSGGGWSTFFFGDVGSSLQDFSTGDTFNYTFTLTSRDVVRITDAENDGDRFDISINGVNVGPTSKPKVGFEDVGECYGCAFFTQGADFSHASYDLGPGTYNIEGTVIQSPYFAGDGAIELGAIPEPATWAMMLIGFFSMGAVVRRRRGLAAAA